TAKCKACGERRFYWHHYAADDGNHCPEHNQKCKWILLVADAATNAAWQSAADGSYQRQQRQRGGNWVEERWTPPAPAALPEPAPEPEPEPVKVESAPSDGAAGQAVAALRTLLGSGVDEDKVRAIVRDETANIVMPTRVVVHDAR